MSVNPNYRRGGVGAKLVQVCATVYLSMLQRLMYTVAASYVYISDVYDGEKKCIMKKKRQVEKKSASQENVDTVHPS